MNEFLKASERNLQIINLENDNSDSISILVFIAQFKENIISQCELETSSSIVHSILEKNYGNNTLQILQKLHKFLIENDTKSALILNEYGVTINVYDKWLFQVILLSSLRNNRGLFQSRRNNCTSTNYDEILREIMVYILRYINITKVQSVILLQVLQLILKYYNILNLQLKVEILKLTNKISISQINNFKHYSRNISKSVICSLNQSQLKHLLNLYLLPVRGIENSDLLLLSDTKLFDSVENCVRKVIVMFKNNIENRDGGFLYEKIVASYEFSQWQQQVWPLFVPYLRHIESDSEFFQSFLKYWIPQNVSTYKIDFYKFICEQPIDTYLKAHILLDSRKKGYYEKDLFNKDLINYFHNQKTLTLALRICSTYHKKSAYPSETEIKLVRKYLHTLSTPYIEEEQKKVLEQFFSQIFLCAHHITKQNDESSIFLLTIYTHFINEVLIYCYKILNSPYFEVSVHILQIIWSTATSSSKYLKLSYKLEENLSYNETQNKFYILLQNEGILKIFTDDDFIKSIGNIFIKSKGNCTNLTKFILSRYVDKISLFESSEDLLEAVEIFSENALLTTADNIKNYAYIYFKKNSNKTECVKLQNVLMENFEANIVKFCESPKMYLIFKNVLILEIILVSLKYNIISKELYGMVEKCMDFVEYILDKDIVRKVADAEEFLMFSKLQKVMETFINNVLYCLLEIEDIWNYFQSKNLILQQLCKIIKVSNMKRPVTLSAEVLKHCGSQMEENHEDKSLKIRFLNDVLNSVFDVSEVPNLKIRRCPEYRLVLHAMCISEKDPKRNLLTWTVNNLLSILRDSGSSFSSLSSALHCLEILTSDTVFHNTTLPFIPKIILECVKLFDSPSWIVRNADLQLIKAIIDRFYGVIISEATRPKNIEDLFQLYPELIAPFGQILNCTPLSNSAIIVLQFFAVSQIRIHPYKYEHIEATRDFFLKIFTRIIKTNAGYIGLHCVDAYIALCFEENIPEIFCDHLKYLNENVGQLRERNVFRNFVTLLKKLYQKFTRSFLYATNENYRKKIEHGVAKFFEILRTQKTVQLDFLLLKHQPNETVLEKINLVNNDDFKNRIWQHNCLPNLILNCTCANIESNLQHILEVNVLQCVQIKILTILVEKLYEKQFNLQVQRNVLNILINAMIRIPDSENYVLKCYFNVILLIFNNLEAINYQIDSKILDALRMNYKQVKNVYKIMTFIVIASQINIKLKSDIKFINNVKEFYFDMDLSNEENAENISSILKYLYICVSCPFDRYKVIKLGIYILLKFGFFEFVSYVTKCQIVSTLDALCKILNYDSLKKCILDDNLIKKLLIDTYNLVVCLNNKETDDSMTFYTEEVDVFVPQCFLDRILEKCVNILIND